MIINKSIEFQCNFFVVTVSGPALLGMPDCERLQLPGINFDKTNTDQHRRHINEHTKQDKSKTKK